ncbi:CAP domain-containing protein [Rhodopseudomonas sp. AAP120]|uniref:CAP domain-containing protein n=1 Tax=Rhodopseudomonas sp. AAP120 TaxID=1523430 RepID=UPI0006B9E2C4|nr:CAP domain-containing protein [Rhodopseudomonas sp. AAP120]
MTLPVIARSEATKQSNSVHRVVDCFAALAMTLMLGVTLFVTSLPTPAHAAGPAELISDFRAKNGEGKVVMDATLNAIAQQQAAGMAAKDVLDHDVVGNFNNRVAPSKASSAAENIAYGYDSFPKTLGQWINSPGHRRNLLLKGATKVGVANAKSASGRTYWAMVIAGGYDKPKPKAKPPAKPAQAAAKGQTRAAGPAAGKDKPAKPKPAPRDCTIKMLGLCF